jgi:hypothetical protein
MRVILPLLVLVAATPALAQELAPGENRGTEQQRAACTGDVFRLCAWKIPNVDNIVACLKQQLPNLTPACRMVFESEPPPPQPPQRSAQQPRRLPSQTEGSSATR